MRTTGLTWGEAQNLLKLGLCQVVTYYVPSHLAAPTINWRIYNYKIARFFDLVFSTYQTPREQQLLFKVIK